MVPRAKKQHAIPHKYPSKRPYTIHLHLSNPRQPERALHLQLGNLFTNIPPREPLPKLEGGISFLQAALVIELSPCARPQTDPGGRPGMVSEGSREEPVRVLASPRLLLRANCHQYDVIR